MKRGVILQNRKLKIPSEVVYILAVALLSLAVAMLTAANFGVLLTSFSVAMFYKTYLYPQVYDFFVKGVSGKFGIKLSRFKTCFDLSCLAVAAIMSLAFFRRFEGIGWGTLVIASINGTIIGFFCRLFDKYFDFTPLFKKFAAHFELDKKQ